MQRWVTLTLDVHAGLHAPPLAHKVVLVPLTAAVQEDAALLAPRVVGEPSVGGLTRTLL